MSMILAARSVGLCRNAARSQVSQIVRRSFQQDATRFFEKHAKRASPLSPSLIVLMKNMPLTALLSITHRVTGLGIAVVLYGVGIAELTYSNLSFEQILQKYNSVVPNAFFQMVKVAAGTAIAFHVMNGIRHLAWDAGYGFQLKHLYRSGYFVVALTALAFAHILSENSK